MHANGQVVDTVESHRPSHVLEASTRKLGKASPDTTGLGRTISKKSLDMAIRHMVRLQIRFFFLSSYAGREMDPDNVT